MRDFLEESLGGADLSAAAILALAVLAGAVLGFLAAALTRSAARRASPTVSASMRRNLKSPTVLLGAALAGRLAGPAVSDGPTVAIALHALLLVGIGAIGWLLVALLNVANDALNERYVLQESDNLTARRILTRFRVLRRMAAIVVGVVTFTAMTMTFPEMRHVGAGILASAGIAGIVLGIAARPFVETLLAGLQLAITHPINIDDVVIVQGEWGRIEEITATYVVVRIWDKRRLIVPISDFITKPFQNWTRVTADLLGVITVDVDYTTPVDAVRRAVGDMLDGCEMWNREFWNLQVVEAGERTMRLRVLVSATDASNGWDLRCHVREWLIGWLQREHPRALPRLRADLGETAPASAEDLA